jgi:hypothetical protein
MIRFVADEDFNNHIVKGLRRRSPTTDIVRLQDVGLSGQRTGQFLRGLRRTNES